MSSISAHGPIGVVWRTPLKRSSVCGVSAKCIPVSARSERRWITLDKPFPLPRYRRPSWRSHHSDLHRPVVLPSGERQRALDYYGQALPFNRAWAIVWRGYDSEQHRSRLRSTRREQRPWTTTGKRSPSSGPLVIGTGKHESEHTGLVYDTLGEVKKHWATRTSAPHHTGGR